MPEREIDIVIRAKAITEAAFAKVEKELAALGGQSTTVGKDAEGAGKGLTSFGGSLSSAFATAGVVLGATAGGVTALGAGLLALGARGSEVADIRESFNTLNKTIGNDGIKSLTNLRNAFAGTVSDYDLMKAANTALSNKVKLSSDDFGLLGKAARVLADRTGGDATDAFGKLTDAMATGKTKSLAKIGVMIDAEKATFSYAKSIRKAVEDLTDADKKDGLAIATKKELVRILGESGEAALDFGDAIAASKTFVGNFTDSLGEAIATSPVVNAMLASFGTGLQNAFGVDQAGLIKTLIGYVNKFALFLVDAGDVSLSVAGAIGRVWSGLQAVFAMVAGAVATMIDTFVGMASQVVQLTASIPGLGSSFKNAAATAKDLALQSKGVAQSFRDQFKEANEGVKGNNAYGKTIETLRGGLGTMRGEMSKAMNATADLTGATKKGHTATSDAGNVVQFMTKAQKEAAKEAAKLRAEMDKWAKSLDNDVHTSMQKVVFSTKELDDHFKAIQKTMTISGSKVIELTGMWREFPKAVKSTGEKAKEAADAHSAATQSMKNSLGELSNAFGLMAQTSKGALGDVAQWLGTVLTASNLASKGADTLKTGFGQLSVDGKNVTAGLVNVAAGAMSVYAAMMQATQSTNTTKNALSGAFAGAQAGAMFGPWGAAIGGVGGALFGMFRAGSNASAQAAKEMKEQQDKLAADTKAANEKLMADLVSQLEKAKATFGSLIDKAKDLGFNFDEQGQFIGVRFQKMKEVAEKYGVSLEALGPSFQKARLHDAATAIIDDFTLLNKGGADVGGTLYGMRGKINDLVNDAIKFGTTIPANMQPWIAELVRAGHLTDVDGNKLTGLGQLRFGDPIKTQFEQISDALLTAVQHLASIVASIAAIPTTKTTTIITHQQTIIDPTIDNSGGGGGGDHDGGGGEEPQLAHGGVVHAPLSGMGITVHGREAIVPLNKPSLVGSRLAAEILHIGRAGNGGADMRQEIAGLRAAIDALANSNRTLPDTLARSMRDGQLQLGGGRR